MDTLNVITSASVKQGSLACSTQVKRARVYAAFARWCRANGHAPSPPSSTAVARYVREHAGRLKASTLRSRVEMLRADHRRAGLPWPDEGPIDAALRDAAEVQRCHHAPATLLDAMETLASELGVDAARDAAILALLAVGLTYDEVAGLRLDDVRIDGDDAIVALRGARSWRGDPRLEGTSVSVMRRWRVLRDDASRTLFHHRGQRRTEPFVHADVARIVLTRCGPTSITSRPVVRVEPRRVRPLVGGAR